MTASPGKQSPMIVHCHNCAHSWPLVYLPMQIEKAVAIMQAAICPKCASRKIFTGDGK